MTDATTVAMIEKNVELLLQADEEYSSRFLWALRTTISSYQASVRNAFKYADHIKEKPMSHRHQRVLERCWELAPEKEVIQLRIDLNKMSDLFQEKINQLAEAVIRLSNENLCLLD